MARGRLGRRPPRDTGGLPAGWGSASCAHRHFYPGGACGSSAWTACPLGTSDWPTGALARLGHRLRSPRRVWQGEAGTPRWCPRRRGRELAGRLRSPSTRASHSPCDEETRPRRGERGPRARGPPRPSTRVSGPAGNTPREPLGLRTSSAGRPSAFVYSVSDMFISSVAVVSGPESYKLCLFAVVAQRLQYSHVTNSRINKQPFSFLTFTKTLEHFVPTRLRLDVNAVVSPATARAPSCLYPLGTRLC